MIKLSIVSALYNSEKYIAKCLDSILNQDIPQTDYEIILVNDGSPDKSCEIAESYAQKHKNIRVITQKNQGPGVARNTGMKEAQGKYLTIIDPDDYLQENIYKNLLQRMETDDLDMLRFGFTMVDEEYNILPMPKGAKNTADYSEEVVDGKVFLSKKLGYACFVWANIYKTSLINENKVYFQPGFYIDDTEWLPRVLMCAKRVSSVKIPAYFYLQRRGSLMNTTAASVGKKLEGCFTAIELMSEESKNQPDKNVKKWYRGLNSVIVIGVLSIISSIEKEKKEFYLKRLLNYKLFPLSYYNHSNHLRIKIAIANISLKLYFKIFS